MANEPRYCKTCDHSRDETGAPFDNANRAFCVQPDVMGNQGPVPCESQRLALANAACGADGKLWSARA